MTPAAIIATLHARGARLAVQPDNRITVTPRSVLDDDLRAALRANKAALLAVLSSRSPFDHRDSCDGTCDESGAGRIACQAPPGKSASADGTVDAFLAERLDPEARAALGWWYDQGHPEILDDELRVLRRLDDFGPVPDVRVELLRLVERVRELRDSYWQTRERAVRTVTEGRS